MSSANPHQLKLGKGMAFVKSRLRRLPQGNDVWEADFMGAQRRSDPRATMWMGLIIHHDGWIVAKSTVNQPPTVNDMANLLAQAMQHPSDEARRRPHVIRLRPRREWEELHPHLAQLGIKVIAAPRLAKWDKAFKDEARQAAAIGAVAAQSKLEETYPTVSRFVRGQGWIEIGDQEGFGFIVRALDYGGLVFESQKPKSLTEALAVLEKGIAEFLKEHG